LPTRVFLLRHGESAAPDVFHGAESDIGLSDRGRRQAEAVATLLAGEHPTVVVSSAMQRARDTAGPIAAACRLPILLEPDLHERRVGALSGTPFAVREGVWPDTLARWMTGDTAYAPAGSESFDDIRRRVFPVWQRLVEVYEGQTIVIVAHGVVCKVLLLTLLEGYGPADWERVGPIRNVALTELVHIGEGWQALRLNEPLAAPPSA
jgi:probable phosphoglycerate mutase